MTAEVAVMNKLGVALAADSAITIGGQKIYNTGNKLFALSKYQPIGIMVYGNAEFMSMPWETIIKLYRGKLAKDNFKSLIDYTENFISFLEKENSTLCTPQIQEDYLRHVITDYLNSLVKDINNEVQSVMRQSGEISETRVGEILANIVNKHFEEWESAAPLQPPASDNYIQEISNNYGGIIEQQKAAIFQQLPLSEDLSKKLTRISVNLFCKSRFPNNTSGIVIAGFGENEIYPSVATFTFEAVVNNRLKYKREQFIQVDQKNFAIIIPFAQREMVNTFVEGIDPSYINFLQGYLRELILKYPDTILKEIPELTETRRAEINNKLQSITNNILSDFISRIDDYRNKSYIHPIMQAVAALPKDELAAMAESLVNLTSFKRRVSLQVETVGGPIDVAVISKGDGFIWIKRKHYFKAELNQAFFTNYYREE